jgi:SAM-dependent methyltransferase
MTNSPDPFFEPYDRQQIAYGDTPAPGVQSIIELTSTGAAEKHEAVDLGAGAGRDSIALALAGYQVTAVDLSERGLERVLQRAAAANVGDLVSTRMADVRDFEFDPGRYSAIIATTVLDHIPAEDAVDLWQQIIGSLAEGGFISVEVHTTEDPGSELPPGCHSDAPRSETAGAVVNYFPPSRLALWATDPAANLRILRYEERLEWDYTHGPEHLHGKATLLAVRQGTFPEWYGQPPAFPRQTDSMGCPLDPLGNTPDQKHRGIG